MGIGSAPWLNPPIKWISLEEIATLRDESDCRDPNDDYFHTFVQSSTIISFSKNSEWQSAYDRRPAKKFVDYPQSSILIHREVGSRVWERFHFIIFHKYCREPRSERAHWFGD
jgi:hypothetical protein